MAFFDEITSFTKGVGAQVKGNYDVVALNAKISGIQREINNLYEKLGNKYYEEKKSSPDDCVAEFVEAINQKFEEISVIQLEIEATKKQIASSVGKPSANSRYCAKCGALVEAGHLFCVKCGAKQPEIQSEAEVAVEPEVHIEVQPEAEPEGNVDVLSEEHIEVPADVQAELVPGINQEANLEKEEEAERTVFCTNCGCKLPSDSTFCIECGNRL